MFVIFIITRKLILWCFSRCTQAWCFSKYTQARCICERCVSTRRKCVSYWAEFTYDSSWNAWQQKDLCLIFLAHGRSFIFPMASAARIRIPPFELRGNFCYCVHASLSLPTSTHRSRHYEWHRRYGNYGKPRPFTADRRGRLD